MGKQPDSCFVTPGPMCILRIIFSVDIDSEARRDWEAHCRMVVTKVWTVGGQRKQQMGRGSGRPEFHQTGDVILIDGDDGDDGSDGDDGGGHGSDGDYDGDNGGGDDDHGWG